MTDPRGLKELKEFWDYYLKGFGKDRNSNENPPEVKSMFYYIFFRIDQSIKEVSTWDRNRFYHVGNYRDGRREDSTGGVVYNSEKNRWEGECEGLAQKLSDEQYDKYRHSLRDPDNPFDASKKPEMLGFGKIHKWAGVTENHIVYRDHWSAIIIPPYKVNLKAECTTSGRWKKVENSERIKERYTDQINAVYLSYMNPGKYMIMDPQYGYNVDTITQWLLPSWTNWGIRDVIKE